MTGKRRGPGVSTRAHSMTATVCDKPNASEIDLALVGADADLWAALFDGRFRLAVQCDVCSRWLTSHTSKAAGRGPTCSAKTVNR